MLNNPAAAASVRDRCKRAVQGAYRLLPAAARRGLRDWGPAAAVRRRWEADTALHDAFYTEDYYAQEHASFGAGDAPLIGRALVERFAPASIVDVGCGAGDYLAWLAGAGVEARGVELAEAGLKICRERGLEVQKLDLTAADALPWGADLVYSFEVAEHLDSRHAARYVGLLTSAARRHVVLTAAGPDQPGLCHVNCREKAYWIALFEAAGFAFEAEATADWERANASIAVAPWFAENLMVFRRR